MVGTEIQLIYSKKRCDFLVTLQMDVCDGCDSLLIDIPLKVEGRKEENSQGKFLLSPDQLTPISRSLRRFSNQKDPKGRRKIRIAPRKTTKLKLLLGAENKINFKY